MHEVGLDAVLARREEARGKQQLGRSSRPHDRRVLPARPRARLQGRARARRRGIRRRRRLEALLPCRDRARARPASCRRRRAARPPTRVLGEQRRPRGDRAAEKPGTPAVHAGAASASTVAHVPASTTIAEARGIAPRPRARRRRGRARRAPARGRRAPAEGPGARRSGRRRRKPRTSSASTAAAATEESARRSGSPWIAASTCATCSLPDGIVADSESSGAAPTRTRQRRSFKRLLPRSSVTTSRIAPILLDPVCAPRRQETTRPARSGPLEPVRLGFSAAASGRPSSACAPCSRRRPPRSCTRPCGASRTGSPRRCSSRGCR